MHTPLPQHRKINKWAFISQGGTSFKRCFLSLAADGGATPAPPSRCCSCAWGLPAALSPQRAGEGVPLPRAPRSFPAPASASVGGQQPLTHQPCPCPAGEHLLGTAVRTLLFLQDRSCRCRARWLGAGTSIAGSTGQSHCRPPPATSLAPARARAVWRCHIFSLGSGRSPAARADGDVGAHSCWHVSPWQQHSEGVGAGRRSRVGSSPALVVLALQGREQGVRC